MKKIAAFFDIDGTISREGLIREMFKKMVKYELIDDAKWYQDVKPAYTKWDRRQGDYDLYLQKMVDIYSETIKNTDAFHISYIAKKVINQRGDRVYTYSRDRIKWHKEQGHLVIAISGSPLELVKEMSRKYGMDHYRGTVYEADEKGKYNGKIIPMWDSASKKKALLEMAELYDIDLAQSFAYGDTSGDFSMLNLVGHPFAINPTKELITLIRETQALTNQITVIVERKDVIYCLRENSFELM